MRRTLSLGVLAFTLGAVGCQDQLTQPKTEATSQATASATMQSATIGPRSDIDRRFLVGPPGMAADRSLDVVGPAINPSDYQCPATETPFFAYINDKIDELIAEEPGILFPLVFTYLADQIPGFEAQFLLTGDTPQSFGYDGDFTRQVIKVERQVKGFWDIDSDDILLLAMKGSMLQDVERVAQVYVFGLGSSPVDALQMATDLKELLNQSTLLNGGDHPLFSYNAFAFDGIPSAGIAPRIVLGDGVLEAYRELGFADVAPQAIYAHEFVHHIQFRNGYFGDFFAVTGDAAEQTRYAELMADAMAAYYLTHKRGATLNWKRVQQFLTIFYQIGDCAFLDEFGNPNPGHHGTPNQRMAAAQWGYELAQSIQKKGQIMTSDEVHDLFVSAYPELIAPDNI